MARQGEGLRIARLLMVLSSMSPLFLLWAIRGSTLIPDRVFISGCAVLVVIPNLALWYRIRIADKRNDRREVVVGQADDHRDHILVYLFTMLLPFFAEKIGAWRDLLAVSAALSFVAFLFWHLNLHYMNIWFAAKGYRVFTIYPPADENPLSGKVGQVLITSRLSLAKGERIIALRLSDAVYLEKK
jgi:hypothetical protein